jgi:hypothetical protein
MTAQVSRCFAGNQRLKIEVEIMAYVMVATKNSIFSDY